MPRKPTLFTMVGSVAGFLFLYLETRTRITMLFADTDTAVDPNALREQLKTVKAAANTQIADITGRGPEPGRAVSVAPILTAKTPRRKRTTWKCSRTTRSSGR